MANPKIPYLLGHAKRNVWCTPNQDKQYIFKPSRISVPGGVINKVTILHDTFNLPTNNEKYHVYQIGQVNPDLLNTLTEKSIWRPISRICRQLNLVIDLYTTNGIHFPRFNAWMLITYDKNIVIAVKEQPKINVSLRTESLYVRFYSNAYFSSARRNLDTRVNAIFVYGKIIANNSDIVDIQTRFATYAAREGVVYGYINGYFTTALNALTIAIGDVVELFFDSTVYKVVELPIIDVDGSGSFESELDLKRKWLLHAPDLITDQIEYLDDIDFFLCKTLHTTVKKGVYYHKNQEDAVRMVTHRDYSLPLGYIQAYVNNADLVTNLNQFTIRLHFRKSGYARPLISEKNHIEDLYKLEPADIPRAMLGIDSTLQLWRAENLEKSNYTRIMRSYEQFISNEMVEDAYGYHGIALALSKSIYPLEHRFGQYGFTPSPFSVQNGTIYEYDSVGKLVHIGGSPIIDWQPRTNSNAQFFEVCMGKRITSKTVYFGTIPEYAFDSRNAEIRCYKRQLVVGVNPHPWIDVTDSDDYELTTLPPEPGNEELGVREHLVWNLNQAFWETAVFPCSGDVVMDFQSESADPVLQFSLNANVLINGSVFNGPLQLPLGELNLFLNGHSLVEDIDYTLKWPQVTIINKRYMTGVQNQSQHIVARMRGFPTPEMKTLKATDSGWVKNGLLSKNGTFNVRDNRHIRITAGGRLYPKDQLNFAEDGTLINFDSLNGTPYSISYIWSPLRDFVTTDVYEMFNSALEDDTAISSYMTSKTPEPTGTIPSFMVDKYELYSPFSARIIDMLLNNDFPESLYMEDQPDPIIRTAVAPYTYLLDNDPTQRSFVIDHDIVCIHPHTYKTVVGLNFFQWRFLTRIVKMFLNDKVDLSKFLIVTNY